MGTAKLTFVDTPLSIGKSLAEIFQSLFILTPTSPSSGIINMGSQDTREFAVLSHPVKAVIKFATFKPCLQDFIIEYLIPCCWGIILPIHISKNLQQAFRVHSGNSARWQKCKQRTVTTGDWPCLKKGTFDITKL